MLYGLLISLFTFMSFFLILLIMIQRGKRSLGLGGLGGGAQMLFGGTGGQELFQKITWVLCGIFMFGGLGLAIMKTRHVSSSRFIGYSVPNAAKATTATELPAPVAETPASTSE